jgi:hypothetical protein
MHERIRYSSWRCPITVEYLRRSLPHLEDQFLMTGCPVIYDTPILSNQPFSGEPHRVVVTVTERGAFWDREQSTLNYIATQYPYAERILALHQVFDDVRANMDSVSGKVPSDLRSRARKLGFRIYRAVGVAETEDLYRGTDLHFGSRLHAHLFCLSQARRSFLTFVDGRCRGFSLAFSFPIIDYRSIWDGIDYEFSICRQQVRYHSSVMDKFTAYVKGMLDEPQGIQGIQRNPRRVLSAQEAKLGS